MARNLLNVGHTESDMRKCGCGRFLSEKSIGFCDQCKKRVCEDCSMLHKREGYEDWKLCGDCFAVELRADAAMVLVMQADRQFVQTANRAAGRELFRAHGYSSVELYQTMRERADVKVMKALTGGVL